MTQFEDFMGLNEGQRMKLPNGEYADIIVRVQWETWKMALVYANTLIFRESDE